MGYCVDKSSVFSFALDTGISADRETSKRYLSNLRGMVADADALEAMIKKENALVYEFYEMGVPENPGDLAFGTSICYPGKVGDEYFMTKGHFHTILDTAEVYYTLSGEGFMMTENPEGDVKLHRLEPGQAVYVPKRWAHRSINTGEKPLITFFVFRGDAGHDYGTIEDKGFRNLVVQDPAGKPVMVKNPAWTQPF